MGKKYILLKEEDQILFQRIKVFTVEQKIIFRKESSPRTIKRIFKKADLVWKRMRKSLKEKGNVITIHSSIFSRT